MGDFELELMMRQDDVRKMVRECLGAGRLTRWESDFMVQLERGRWITEKQAETATEIWRRRCGVHMMQAVRGGRRR